MSRDYKKHKHYHKVTNQQNINLKIRQRVTSDNTCDNTASIRTSKHKLLKTLIKDRVVLKDFVYQPRSRTGKNSENNVTSLSVIIKYEGRCRILLRFGWDGTDNDDTEIGFSSFTVVHFLVTVVGRGLPPE